MKENSPKTSFELMLPKEWVELVKSRKEDIPVEGRSVSRSTEVFELSFYSGFPQSVSAFQGSGYFHMYIL